jgi:hypothetical protein
MLILGRRGCSLCEPGDEKGKGLKTLACGRQACRYKWEETDYGYRN